MDEQNIFDTNNKFIDIIIIQNFYTTNKSNQLTTYMQKFTNGIYSINNNTDNIKAKSIAANEEFAEAYAFFNNIDIETMDNSNYRTTNEDNVCEIRVVQEIEGKDPDEFIREFGGEEYLKKVQQAPLLLDYQLNQVFLSLLWDQLL